MTTRERNILLPMEDIVAFCGRNPIQKLSVFGSVLRDDFSENSDIDFLIELLPNSGVGLFKFMNMQFELEDMLGRKVDLRTPQDLHERFRDSVVEEAELLYVRKK